MAGQKRQRRGMPVSSRTQPAPRYVREAPGDASLDAELLVSVRK